MTTFQDGPAKGQRLMLHRAARFLRVTELNGKWDALDQPSDTPRPDEKLYAYEIVGKPGHMHLNTGRKPGGGFYPIAEYRFVPAQPTDAQMRDREQWYRWCDGHEARPDLQP